MVLTSAGKVFALHNGDGRVMWSMSYGPEAAPNHLFSWCQFHDLTHAPQLVVMTTGPASKGFQATVLDAHTGVQLKQDTLQQAVSQVVPIAQPVHDDNAEQKMFLLVTTGQNADEQQQIIVYPDNAAVRQSFEQHCTSIYFWQLQQQAGRLVGYTFNKQSVSADGVVQSRVAWTVSLPGYALAVTSRDPTEPVHSTVKVMEAVMPISLP